MRRIALLLIVLAAIGAAVWFFVLRGPGGQPPALASAVSQQHTLAFGAIEHPDELARVLLKQAEQIAPPEQAQLMLDLNARTGAVGFDPATAAGWQSIGVDPARGGAVVVDAQAARPAPYAVLRITDEAAFLKWLGARMGGAATREGDALIVPPNLRVSVATRGDLTLLSPAIEPTQLKAIAARTGPTLDAAPGFDAVFSRPSTPGAGRLAAFAPTTNLKALPPLADPALAPSVDFYAERFPALGVDAGGQTMRLTLVTAEAGRAALQQIFSPRKRPPAFSKWLPAKDFGVMRASGNLREVFSGVQALLPPAVPTQVRGQVGLAKMGLAAVGLDWSLLTEAFTGHIAVAFQPRKGAPPHLIALFALGNPAKADALLKGLETRAGAFLGGMGGGVPIQAATVEGLPGRRISVGGQAVLIVRVDEMLVVASSADLAAQTVRRGKTGKDSLSGTSAGALVDSDLVLGFTMKAESLATPFGLDDAMRARLQKMPAFELAVRLEKQGLVLEGQTLSFIAGLGGMGYAMFQTAEDSQRRARDQLQRLEAAQERQRALERRLDSQRNSPGSEAPQ